VKKEKNYVGEKCSIHRKYRKKVRMLVGKKYEKRHIGDRRKTSKAEVKWILKAELCYDIHHIQDRGQGVGCCVKLMNTKSRE
jgi:hypothetical protein